MRAYFEIYILLLSYVTTSSSFAVIAKREAPLSGRFTQTRQPASTGFNKDSSKSRGFAEKDFGNDNFGREMFDDSEFGEASTSKTSGNSKTSSESAGFDTKKSSNEDRFREDLSKSTSNFLPPSKGKPATTPKPSPQYGTSASPYDIASGVQSLGSNNAENILSELDKLISSQTYGTFNRPASKSSQKYRILPESQNSANTPIIKDGALSKPSQSYQSHQSPSHSSPKHRVSNRATTASSQSYGAPTPRPIQSYGPSSGYHGNIREFGGNRLDNESSGRSARNYFGGGLSYERYPNGYSSEGNIGEYSSSSSSEGNGGMYPMHGYGVPSVGQRYASNGGYVY